MYNKGDTKTIIAQFTDEKGSIIMPDNARVTIKCDGETVLTETDMTRDSSDEYYFFNFPITDLMPFGDFVVLVHGVFSWFTAHGYEIFNVKPAITQTIWDAVREDHFTEGTFGEAVSKILGLSQQNIRMFDQLYDDANNLLSCSMKIYKNANDVDSDSDPLATYRMEASYDEARRVVSYKLKEI